MFIAYFNSSSFILFYCEILLIKNYVINVSVIAGIFTFIGGTVFGATVISMGLLIYCMISKKKKSKLNVPASKVRPSSGVAVYEEINAAVSTSSKPIELQDNAAYGKMQSRH